MKAILSKKSNDDMRSRILSNTVSMLILEIYVTPTEFAKLLEKCVDKELLVEVTPMMST